MFSFLTTHLDNKGETYWEHLFQAWNLAWNCTCMSMIFFIHGICPFLFERTGTDKFIQLHSIVTKRNKL